jgi:hypothetical protein
MPKITSIKGARGWGRRAKSAPAPAFAYSWTVPFSDIEYDQYWFIDTTPEPYNTTITLTGLNPRSVTGYPQTNTIKTFTISGITGANAALNGTTITALAEANQIENTTSFGAAFTSTYIALGLQQFVGNPKVLFPGFTLNWS